MSSDAQIRMFGADWCRDCIRTKKQLDELGIDYEYVDLVADPAAADVAKEISGRTSIPVVVYPTPATTSSRPMPTSRPSSASCR